MSWSTIPTTFGVLDKGFFTIPVSAIPFVEVVMTGLGGEIVYDPDGIDSY